VSQPTLVPTEAGKAAYLRRITFTEKVRLATEIVRTYIRARWLLAWRDFPEALAEIRRSDNELREPDGDMFLVAHRLGKIVGRTLGALPADAKCLVRSLVLAAMLAKRGIFAKVVIGVQTQPVFKAHAWVECGGYEVLPSGGDHYERLTEL
jgi:transglutaminase-like putative cysteine protease